MTQENRKERTPMPHSGRLQVLLGFRCSRCSHFLLHFRSFALLSDGGGWGREHLWSVDWGRCSSVRRFDKPSSPSRESEARGIGSVTTSAICELKKTSAKRQYWDKKGTKNLPKKPKEKYCACENCAQKLWQSWSSQIVQHCSVCESE
jgi:hypothetical protein